MVQALFVCSPVAGALSLNGGNLNGQTEYSTGLTVAIELALTVLRSLFLPVPLPFGNKKSARVQDSARLPRLLFRLISRNGQQVSVGVTQLRGRVLRPVSLASDGTPE